ncbi:hypothetical protein PHYBOEH_000437 [Phytophthora boehmeriae]|uniref:Uncharacterized protein n=1 Tax=Phytophthora boehmeriae TaxID=109152 RepID=A0A8T1WVZ9_9STRA|nr:hypothetical protein PHYBOEH_000437 [Phytophthora boehmeriae]
MSPLFLNGKMETNSVVCLEYVKQHATHNDPASVVSATDAFAANNTIMNVGKTKARIIDAEIRQMKPRVMAGVGAYTGYSTVHFAATQRTAATAAGVDSHYYSFEYSPEFEAVYARWLAAGLDDQVTVIEDAFPDQLKVLEDKTVDIDFIDHDDSL